jgi:hypothetical protein
VYFRQPAAAHEEKEKAAEAAFYILPIIIANTYRATQRATAPLINLYIFLPHNQNTHYTNKDGTSQNENSEHSTQNFHMYFLLSFLSVLIVPRFWLFVKGF